MNTAWAKYHGAAGFAHHAQAAEWSVGYQWPGSLLSRSCHWRSWRVPDSGSGAASIRRGGQNQDHARGLR